MRYTVAKFLNGPLAGTERTVENKGPIAVSQLEMVLGDYRNDESGPEVVPTEPYVYLPLPHIFVDQNYTYYTLERKHAHDSPTDSADITRHVSSD